MIESQTEEVKLVSRMLAGEEKAFESFFDTYFPGLYRFALARLDRNDDAAEEVVQAAVCRAISGLKTFRGEASLFTWLCTICRNEISRYFKKRNKTPEGVPLIEDSPAIRAALESLGNVAAGQLEETLDRRELGRLVHVVLDQLPPRYGNALEWKYLDGYSVNEIAARLGSTPKAAESLLTRARNAFREGFSTIASTEVLS